MLGAGKGTLAEHLSKKHKFTYYSVRNFFAQEVLKQGKMVNRASIAEAAASIRAEHGAAYAVEQLLAQPSPSKDIAIESIRTKEEAIFLKSKGAVLWAVAADQQTRYQRTLQRDASVEQITFETFAEKEKNEASLVEAMALADTTFDNNGTKEEFFEKVEKALQASNTGA